MAKELGGNIVNENRVLQKFTTTNGLVGWIDILNVRKMSPERRAKLYEILSSFLPGYSINHFQSEDYTESINETNALIVGDAVRITQSNATIGSRLFVLHVVLRLSEYLFNEGFAHRGSIVYGPYEADHPENGLPFITGDAIIRAVEIEENLKLCAIEVEQGAFGLCKSLKDKLGDLMWTRSLYGGRNFISRTSHFLKWKKFAAANENTHVYSARAKLLTDDQTLWETYERT